MLASIIFKTSLIKKRHEIKLGVQKYAVIMPVEKSCITFNNNYILQRHCTELQHSAQSGSAFVQTQSQNFALSPYSKAPAERKLKAVQIYAAG
jgi:hypothetical protein